MSILIWRMSRLPELVAGERTGLPLSDYAWNRILHESVRVRGEHDGEVVPFP